MRTWILALAFTATSAAGPISIGPWYEFGFDPNHAPTVSGCQPDDPAGVPCRAGVLSLNLTAPPWTFTSSGVVQLNVTDAFLAGDAFTVFDFGALVGGTPAVALSGVSCGFDPRVCFLDPAFSHASFLLPPGSHSLTVTVQPAQIQGEGFLQLLAVPEPSMGVAIPIAIAGLCRLRPGGARLDRLNACPTRRVRRGGRIGV